MIPFFDFGFLVCLVVKRPGSAVAWRTIQPFPAPYYTTWFHALQMETMFIRGQLGGDPAMEKAVLHGAQLWRFYQQEGVFQHREVDWDAALRLALNLAKRSTTPQPQPSMFLHTAAASLVGATHLLSFDPRTRQIGTLAGLKNLPERL